ncbi:Fe-S protein assembly co-chaperone HscB [Gulbenkiania mobilis]|uniref:Fe-S protein assembly co-chaperone HscB n=1 Tax=Gulbenkiania mobilis TaxID=397457 RepID=UPI0006BBD69B|nr:Fe-S protein assembly co-chaperone HscB [Gulbenkiania mobilis]
MNADFNQDHFALFGLPRRFRLDDAALDSAYRKVASEVHPDRYAHAGDAEKRLALMMATRVNEAYRMLRAPLARARYLLSLAGVDTQEETNTSMPPDFLMAQMEWREAVGDARAARDVGALEEVSANLARERRGYEAELAEALDDRSDTVSAALLVRKLRFLEKLEQEAGDAIEALLF